MAGIFCLECDEPVRESRVKYHITGAGSIPIMVNHPCNHDAGLRFDFTDPYLTTEPVVQRFLTP